MDHGRIVLSGAASELAADSRVADTYLGRGSARAACRH
jgi:ABC-type branched-subunit amino acid transport system ATPase component